MGSPHSDGDDELLAELRVALAEPGPVPADFREAALAAFTWRTIDEELVLAELVFDSTADAGLALRNGSRGSARTLTFHGDGISVEIEMTDGGIVGQMIPATDGGVAGETAAGTFDRTDVDETGCFMLRPAPPGPVRLRVQTGRYHLVTGWVCAD